MSFLTNFSSLVGWEILAAGYVCASPDPAAAVHAAFACPEALAESLDPALESGKGSKGTHAVLSKKIETNTFLRATM
jgi:hypothetical protein